MTRSDVGNLEGRPAVGRRTWLCLAGAAALWGIARGGELEQGDRQDPSKGGPSDDELEGALAEARKVTTRPLVTVRSAHFQAVGDASEDFMKQVLLECEGTALDFLRYYRSQGFEVQLPERRMTLVVLADKEAFLKTVREAPANVAGMYSYATNVITFYDRRNVRGSEVRAGRINMITVSHETTHQLTFNTGMLNRKGDVPKCIVEGLAVYGEVRSAAGHNEPGRIHHGRLDELATVMRFRKWLAMSEVLAQDKKVSYPQSWLLVHFLMKHADRLPQFRAYLKTIYPRTDNHHRLEDARAHLGDLDLLDRELQRYAIRLQRSV
jgi:hypothetical protein